MSKHKHRHRHEEEMGNPLFDPNMLSILLLILGVFGKQEPIYNFDEELLNNQHNKASKKGAGKPSDPGYTGGSVLSKDIDSQDEADSYENYKNDREDDIGYAGGHSEGCGSVIESDVVKEYPSRPIKPAGSCSPVVITVPVVLTQLEVEFEIEAVITLDQPALDIKRVKKNVFLDQCRLLPKANKLFVGGIIRKNIEYGTEDNIRHATVEVPFKFTTEVEYFTTPVISPDCETLEIETLRADGMGTDLTERAFINKEHFNERIYCKLISSDIRELDLLDEGKGENEKQDCERLSETLTEKMVVKLNIKLMQEQEIEINK